MKEETIFSDDRLYRYTLWRRWPGPQEFVQFIGLNPSTADETLDDPTIRRCIGFAKAWGFGGLCVTNLFGLRATLPKDMKAHPSPTGQGNFFLILSAAREASLVIAAWGAHGDHRNWARIVSSGLIGCGIKLHCLGLNSDGTPKHPLYLKKTSAPQPYEP